MPETDAVLFDDPINRPARRAAAEAVPEILRRRDDQRGGGILMERAMPNEVLAGFLQFNVGTLDQALYRYLIFQPLDFFLWYPRH
jgi:hypothetical protein